MTVVQVDVGCCPRHYILRISTFRFFFLLFWFLVISLSLFSVTLSFHSFSVQFSFSYVTSGCVTKGHEIIKKGKSEDINKLCSEMTLLTRDKLNWRVSQPPQLSPSSSASFFFFFNIFKLRKSWKQHRGFLKCHPAFLMLTSYITIIQLSQPETNIGTAFSADFI